MKKIILLIIMLLALNFITYSSISKNTQVSKTTNNTLNATIYLPNIEDGCLDSQDLTINKLTPNILFNELKNNNIITKNTNLISFDTYIKNNENIGVINFSKEFYSFNLGSLGELLMLNSIAKTYIVNFDLDKFKILIEGNEYESGHVSFRENEYFTLDFID